MVDHIDISRTLRYSFTISDMDWYLLAYSGVETDYSIAMSHIIFWLCMIACVLCAGCGPFLHDRLTCYGFAREAGLLRFL